MVKPKNALTKQYAKLFDLGKIGAKLGWPMYLKPYDGGGWRAHGRSEEVRGRGIGYDYVHSLVDDHSRFCVAAGLQGLAAAALPHASGDQATGKVNPSPPSSIRVSPLSTSRSQTSWSVGVLEFADEAGDEVVGVLPGGFEASFSEWAAQGRT